MKGFYFITDEGLSRTDIFHDVREAVSAGAACVQYRSKSASSAKLFAEALKIRTLCRGIPLIINDRVDIALAVSADGVHLGQDDLPVPVARTLVGKNKVIGVTVHSVEEAVRAVEEGADYLGVSPVFGTLTKHDAGRPAGVGLVSAVRKECPVPLVAIGGITLENAPSVVASGADAVCAISAVLGAQDLKKEILKFRELFR